MSAWTYRQSDGKAASKIVPPRLRIPCWKGLGADSEEKREPASDIDTVVVDSLKALDPEWPIREADIWRTKAEVRKVPDSDIHPIHKVNQGTGYGCSGTGESTLMAAPPFSLG